MNVKIARIINRILITIACIALIFGIVHSNRAATERAHDASDITIELSDLTSNYNEQEPKYTNGCYHVNVGYKITNNTSETIDFIQFVATVKNKNDEALAQLNTDFGGNGESINLKAGESKTYEADLADNQPLENNDVPFMNLYNSKAADLHLDSHITSVHWSDGASFSDNTPIEEADIVDISEAPAGEDSDEESNEDANDNTNEDAGADIISDVSSDIIVHSWDLDFSNSEQKNDDGTISYDSIMLVTNSCGRDITGFAYTVKNEYGEKVANQDNRCVSDAPFYAEGYIPVGETGVMVSMITVDEEEYEKENPKYSTGHRLRSKSVKIIEAYAFRGEDGYRQATGMLIGEDEKDSKERYAVDISNETNTPVHKGASIVAVKKDYDDDLRINVASAKGRVDEEIPANVSNVVIKDAFINPGLADWPSESYEVCVIDNEYSDKSHYYDSFREKYFK